MKKISAVDVNGIAASNKLRMYPGAKRGRRRLLPFARPEVISNQVIKEDATFFVAGNCFARSIEKALKIGGKRVLSSPYNPEMPGDAIKQFQRYNIFNLDIATNEILWATQHPDDLDSALIEVGDELVDMQLHFSVAYPADEMRRIRRIYNSSYAAIRDADVVIGVVGGMRQWYDSRNDIYLNVQPTRRMVSDYPDRFELHEFDVNDMKNSLRRFHDVVLKANKNATLLLAVSPVSQPSTYTAQDALVSQYYSKAIQRVAVEEFVQDSDNVEYIAALETAYLSDFKYTFLQNSLHHTRPNLGIRVTADFLRQRGDQSVSQKLIEAYGYGNDLLLAGENEEIVGLIGPLVSGEDRLEISRYCHVELHRLYVTALVRLDRRDEALSHLMDMLKDPRYAGVLDGASLDDDEEDDERDEVESNELTDGRLIGKRPDHIFNLARGIVLSIGGKADFDALVAYANERGYDTSHLSFRRNADPAGRKILAEFMQAYRSASFKDVLRIADNLEDKRDEMDAVQRRQFDTLTLQAYLKSGNAHAGIDRLMGHLQSSSGDLDSGTVIVLCNISRSHAKIEQLDKIVELARTASLGEEMLKKLTDRQAVLLKIKSKNNG
ncbi:MAG: GSCFA domain-containing protein [Paracoccus sp. (in: a-proteobacteria)]